MRKLKKLVVYEISKGSNSFDKNDVLEMFEYCRVECNDIMYPVTITNVQVDTDLPDDKYCVKFYLEYSKELKLEDIIKEIAGNYENPFILVSPTEEQELIVDFTLDADIYYKLLNSKNTDETTGNNILLDKDNSDVELRFNMM